MCNCSAIIVQMASQPDYDVDTTSIDHDKKCSIDVFNEGHYYDHCLPRLKFFELKAEAEQFYPQSPTLPQQPNRRIRPYISFIGQYQDYGSIAGGFGVKVMHKMYQHPADDRCMTWCANRHVPLVKTVGFHHNGMDIGKSIVYDHVQKKAYALLDGKVIGMCEHSPPKAMLSDGQFYINKFYHDTEYLLYLLCKHVLTDPKMMNDIVFIGNFAVPQRFVWDHFNQCWDTISKNEMYNWKMEYFQSVYEQPIAVAIPFDFSMKNRKMLDEELDPNNWSDELVSQALAVIKSRDRSRVHKLQRAWLDQNTITLETHSRRRIVIFRGTEDPAIAKLPQDASVSMQLLFESARHLAEATAKLVLETREPEHPIHDDVMYNPVPPQQEAVPAVPRKSWKEKSDLMMRSVSLK